MLTFFRKTMRNDKGAVMPIIGLSIITLMVFIGVAIDMGRYFLVRNKLLTALDSALLGAANISTINLAQNDPKQIIDRGKEFFLANYPVNYLGTNITDQNIAIRVSPETGTVYGDVVDVSLPLVFAGIFQLSSPKAAASAPNININVFSEVQRVLGTNLEIALVLDYTPSMCFQLNTGSMFGTPRVADAACGKFNKMKEQTVSFIRQIEKTVKASESQSAGAFFSFIPFTHTVRIDDSLKDLNLCFPVNQERTLSARGLTGTSKTIIDLIESSEKAPTEGGSNIATAMWWGWSSLRNNAESQGLFTGISAKDAPANVPGTVAQVNKLEVRKILLLLTDGENEYPNRDCQNDLRTLSGDGQGFQRDLTADDRFAQLCEAAKAEGVAIFTIAFNVPSDSKIKTRALLNACANPGRSYNADNYAQLERAFDQIVNDLIDLRVTQ